MIPLDLRPREPEEDVERRRALAAADGRAPAADDPVLAVWTVMAVLLGLALVVSLIAR